jgi:20S proteasome subunit alpha 7
MSSTGAGYDFGANTYSPDGRVFQVEYADKAVSNSGTVMAVRCTDGVVMGVEKLLISKMLVEGTNRRLHACDEHVGIAVAGINADGRQLVNRGRSEARNYRENYGMPIPPEVLAHRLASVVHAYTRGYYRPFGCSIVVAGYDADLKDHQVYQIEPNGTMFRYYGCAMGKGKQAAITEIEKNKFFEMNCRDALKQIAKTMYILHDEVKDKPFELEMSWCCEESGWKHSMVSKEIRDEAQAWAKQKIEEEEMEDDDDDDDDED